MDELFIMSTCKNLCDNKLNVIITDNLYVPKTINIV